MPDDLREQLVPLKEICIAIGFPLIEIGGVEADDVIATLVRLAKEKGFKSVISSLDKDRNREEFEHLLEDVHI